MSVAKTMAEHLVETLSREIDGHVGLINECLSIYLTNYPYQTAALLEVAEYSVGSPGHRWRPVLFIKAYKSLSPQRDLDPVLPLACAIEFIHTASIIFDDLPSMDNATLRRGKRPCHVEFGEARAILAACWLLDVAQHLTHEFSLSNAAIDPEPLLRLTKNEMMQGQVLDLSQGRMTEAQVLEMYRQKSGALYALSASLPAYILGLTEVAEHLNDFGNYLGIAYQLSDDIHDCTDTAEVIGKDVGQDCGKNTVPRLFGIDRAIELRREYKNRAVAALERTPIRAEDFIDLVEKICL